MAEAHTPRWPIALFTVTIFCALASAVASVYYYRSTTLLQNQTQTWSEIKAQYDSEISALQNSVVTTQISKQIIPTPVTTLRRECIKVLNDVCIEIPDTRIEQREIQTTIAVEDPTIKAALDQKRSELEKLSAEAASTQATQVNRRDIVDVIRGLVLPIMSLLVIIASLFVILSKRYKAESEKWAYGSIGTLLGYWVKYF